MNFPSCDNRETSKTGQCDALHAEKSQVQAMMATEAAPRYHSTMRLALLDLVIGEPAPLRALDIGCGTGVTLQALKHRFPLCHTTGLEVQPAIAVLAQEAGCADRVLAGDVLDPTEVDFPEASFDLILVSHVLEHFAEPGSVLKRVQRWLAPGGQVLVALPNVRHASVIYELLLRADFEYKSAGILDRTHLRFFTRKSALRFLIAEGWRVEACEGEIDGPKSLLLNRLTCGLARDFATFAYNFRLRAP
jgi:SAM-dependent methyltransferase